MRKGRSSFLFMVFMVNEYSNDMMRERAKRQSWINWDKNLKQVIYGIDFRELN